ncbi:hypothetical protein [Bacillus sp. FJAT-27245]|nr:hypothetical protein [Bacillus sp. FJAT-27245]
MIESILRILFQVNKYESRLLDGIRANKEVEIESKHYDSYCKHKVIWGDI